MRFAVMYWTVPLAVLYTHSGTWFLLGTGEPGEPLYDSHFARHMAWCVGLRIAGVLALFAILPVFLGTVLKKVTPYKGIVRLQL
jgi:hypothetical protein